MYIFGIKCIDLKHIVLKLEQNLFREKRERKVLHNKNVCCMSRSTFRYLGLGVRVTQLHMLHVSHL